MPPLSSVRMTEKAGMCGPHTACSPTWGSQLQKIPEGTGAVFCMGPLERGGPAHGQEGRSPARITSMGFSGIPGTQSFGEPPYGPLDRLRQPKSKGCWQTVGRSHLICSQTTTPLVPTHLSNQACLYHTVQGGRGHGTARGKWEDDAVEPRTGTRVRSEALLGLYLLLASSSLQEALVLVGKHSP